MMALVGFITSPLGKMAGIAAVVALLVVGAKVMLNQHDNGIRDADQAAAKAAAADALEKQHTATVAAMEALTKAVQDRAVSSEQIRGVIHAASSSSACAGSPAMAAALDGLRQRLNAGSGSADRASKPADVQR